MQRIRRLADRVRRLEQVQKAHSPFELAYGSLEDFVAEMQKDIDAGRFDHIDGPIVIQCIIEWHRRGCWNGWRRPRNQVWEYVGR